MPRYGPALPSAACSPQVAVNVVVHHLHHYHCTRIPTSSHRRTRQESVRVYAEDTNRGEGGGGTNSGRRNSGTRAGNATKREDVAKEVADNINRWLGLVQSPRPNQMDQAGQAGQGGGTLALYLSTLYFYSQLTLTLLEYDTVIQYLITIILQL